MLSRQGRAFFALLSVKLKPPGQHGNAKINHWHYFSFLCNTEGRAVEEDRVYSSLCLEEQKSLGQQGHQSKVCNFAATTSSGNMNMHPLKKNDIQLKSEKQKTKITSNFKKYNSKDNSNGATAHLSHEVTPYFVI